MTDIIKRIIDIQLCYILWKEPEYAISANLGHFFRTNSDEVVVAAVPNPNIKPYLLISNEAWDFIDQSRFINYIITDGGRFWRHVIKVRGSFLLDVRAWPSEADIAKVAEAIAQFIAH